MENKVQGTGNGNGKNSNNRYIKWFTALRKRIIYAVVFIFFLLSAYICWTEQFKPVEASAAEQVEVRIHPNFSAREIGNLLASKGLIRSSWFFAFYTRISGKDARLKSGVYSLSPSESLEEIIDKITRGEVVYRKVTVPEGMNLNDIADLLQAKGIVDRQRFLKVAAQADFDFNFIKGIPKGPKRLEGFLFPDTYRFSGEPDEKEVLEMFLKRFREVYNTEFRKRAEELNMNTYEVVTLASIIEREAVKEEERPIISSVFHNRLKLGQPLQSCATVRYALNKYRGQLTYDDLLVDSPYNTYKFTGLPQGPIASPGYASLKAALYPADTDYFYFVAKPDGSHAFSRTLAEHNAAKEKYSP